MSKLPKAELEAALRALDNMTCRSEKAQLKFAPGTAQHTLQKKRIAALCIALELVKAALAGQPPAGHFTKEDLQQALAPLTSLANKSEKARQKLAPGSWQHKMLDDNLKALHIAVPLLTKALE